MDFGVARFAMGNITGTGMVVGTAEYMSPEQVRGEVVDGRSDLFSAGAMLYELVRGTRPFHADGIMAIFYKITHDDPAFDFPYTPEYRALIPILGKALAKDATARYQNASEFADALRAVRHGAGPRAPAPCRRRPRPPRRRAPRPRRKRAPPPTSALPVAPPRPSPRRPADHRRPGPLFQLMRDIFVSGRTGHLHFTRPKEWRSLRFLKGQILHATSDVEGEHLGDVLVRYGLLAQEDLERARRVVLSERRKLGTVLDSMGIMAKEELESSIKLHVREVLFNVTEMPDVKFSFEELGEDSVPGGGAAVARRSRRDDPGGGAPHPGAGGRGQGARRHRPRDRARRPSRAGRPEAHPDAHGRVRALARGRHPDRARGLPPDAAARRRTRSAASSRCSARAPSNTARPRARPRTRRAGRGTGLGRDHHRPASAAARRRLPPSPPRPRWFHRRRPPPPPRPSRAADRIRRATEAARKAAAEARRREIQELHDGLRTKDHFEILGIARNSNADEVKDAYFRLARPYHPDAPLDPSLEDLRDKRSAVFIRLGEAYETLRNPTSRSRYENAFPPRRAPRPEPPRRRRPPPATSPSLRDPALDGQLAGDRAGQGAAPDGRGEVLGRDPASRGRRSRGWRRRRAAARAWCSRAPT